MYATILELQSWMGTMTHFIEGETPADIMSKFERVQDLRCLVSMGRSEENESGQEELDKIEIFLDKCHSGELTIQDIKEFSFNLSIGAFRCIDVAEGEEAVAALKTAHPEAK